MKGYLGVEVDGLDARLVLDDVEEAAVGEVLAADVGARGEQQARRRRVLAHLGEQG